MVKTAIGFLDNNTPLIIEMPICLLDELVELNLKHILSGRERIKSIIDDRKETRL